MNKKLIAIPVIVDGQQLERTLQPLLNKLTVDILIIDNSENDSSVQATLEKYSHQLTVIKNRKNIYVTASWNKSIEYFLSRNQFNRLIILNSDLLLQKDWEEVVNNRWAVNENEVLIPTISDTTEVDTSVQEGRVIESAAGIFITLNRKQAEMVYPIPEEIKIWYNDDWIYSILRSQNMPTVLVPNLLAQHEESSSIRRVKDAHEVIEQDKINWAEIVKEKLEQKIKQLNQK